MQPAWFRWRLSAFPDDEGTEDRKTFVCSGGYLAGLESLSVPGRRVFQPPPPPTVEGYAYRIPVEGEDERSRVVVVAPSETLTEAAGGCSVVLHDGAAVPLAPDLRAVVIADGALCHAAALRRLLERGTALRFVESVVPAPGETAPSPPG